MSKKARTGTDPRILNEEFITYVEQLRREWLAKNRPHTINVWEVMHPFEREQVEQCRADWGKYITPLAEAWWRERGYGVMWPNDNSQPMKVYKLETA